MIKINTKNRIKTAIALLFLSALMISFNFISIYVLIVFGIFSILEFLEMTKKIFFNRLFRYTTNTIFIFYILFFCYFFFYFLNFIHLKIIIFILLFGCVASDIGGYFVGKFLKGPKLIKISPKKTYSGAIGSVIFTCFTISILFYLITNNFSYVILIISILTSLSCQVGDLIFSYFKRKANIKDTGNILPGHGGILDRIDGVLLGIPVGIISFIILM